MNDIIYYFVAVGNTPSDIDYSNGSPIANGVNRWMQESSKYNVFGTAIFSGEKGFSELEKYGVPGLVITQYHGNDNHVVIAHTTEIYNSDDIYNFLKNNINGRVFNQGNEIIIRPNNNKNTTGGNGWFGLGLFNLNLPKWMYLLAAIGTGYKSLDSKSNYGRAGFGVISAIFLNQYLKDDARIGSKSKELLNTKDNKARIEALKTIKETQWTGEKTHDTLDKALTAINLFQGFNSGHYIPTPIRIKKLSGIFMVNENGTLNFESRIIKISEDEYRMEHLTTQGYNDFEKTYTEVISK